MQPDSQKPAKGHREDGRPMQPHGQEPSRHKEQERPSGPPAPPHRERDRDRDHSNPVVWREVASDKRPKSSYTNRDESPQSPRDKRPLSGPNVRTPNLPVTEGVMKTAQQTRPFNTYPRSESDSARNPSSQVSTDRENKKKQTVSLVGGGALKDFVGMHVFFLRLFSYHLFHCRT